MKIEKSRFSNLALSFFIVLFGAAGYAAAQTCDVTWRKAENPRVITSATTIPANQTVCVEPGVRVQFGAEGKITLFGRMAAVGAANDRIIFTGGNVFPNRVEVVGSIDLRFADISVPLNVNPGGSLTCRDCNFTARGMVLTLDGIIFSYIPKFILVENSVFDSDEEFNSDNAAFYVSDATIVLRNTQFRSGAFCNIGKSNLHFDNVTSQNARFDGLTFLQDVFQPQFLNNLSVTNASDAGLHLMLGNFEIGPNATIQNNEFPIRGGAGLLPGSNIPATGNLNNWIELTGMQPYSIFAPFQIPYVTVGGRLSSTQILPGVTLKARPGAIFDTFGSPHAEVLGLPNAPITFEQFTPGAKWTGLEFFQDGDRMEYVVFDGSQRGAYSSVAGHNSVQYFDQMIFRNNDVALNNQSGDLVYAQGTLFANNGIAVRSEGNASTYRLSGETNPNLFENNALAVRAVNGAIVDARYNWWNSPTGPTAPQNPGGTGDPIEGNVQFQPFRTARPDRADHPPVVRLPRRPFLLTAGSFEGVIEPEQKVILRWDAFDNNAIVKHKILLSLNGNQKENFTVVADNLPGSARAYEFTMPASAGTAGGFRKFIRIVAVDDKGQEGFEELNVQVPTGTEPGVLQITTPLGGQTFRGGSEFNVNWTITTPFNDPSFQVFLILDGNRQITLAANGVNTGTFSTVKLPYVSTDSARIAVKSQGSINNVKWFYSEPFAIRPDPRYPDAPPTISMTSPSAGQTFPAGGIVPVSWTAADDEAIRSFTILYSTDGGRTWLTMVENLPPTATGYNWQTPLGTGFNNVRVRVVAYDRRFQNSSDGASRVFQITPNQIAFRRTQFDFDGDGRADIGVFRQGNWYLQQSTNGFTAIQFGVASDKLVPADYDGDGKTDVAVYRSGTWYLQRSAQGFTGVAFGAGEDIPVPADYDGD
ncbi:MAG TPA: Ig-like domain-containing protein, partial [Pyrinomonadaceae bacterium]|nr:Ig-like domain-containing protein [Pyrinomonadaceae bacterium]